MVRVMTISGVTVKVTEGLTRVGGLLGRVSIRNSNKAIRVKIRLLLLLFIVITNNLLLII